jgi:hypothetical protein
MDVDGWQRRILRGLGATLLCAMIAGCAGNGEGLDENGRPIDENPPPADDDFTVIQDTIFTPICTVCHAGAQAPLGLRLDEGESYAMLVDVPSVEVPALLRVAPGDPEGSYIVHKIEGSAAIGGQMPLGGPPLDAGQIDLIRQWIAAGAEPPVAAMVAMAAPARLVVSAPAAGETMIHAPAEVLAVFSRPLDPNLLLETTVTLTASGGDGGFGDGNEEPVTVSLQSGAPGGASIRIRPVGRLAPDDYELRLRGSGPTLLADGEGQAIDGDGDGIAGGDAVVRFRIAGEQP